MGLEEQIAATRVLNSGWLAQGQESCAFENELCDFFGIPYGSVLVVSSGSAALYLALWLMKACEKNIGLPSYACAALRNAVGLAGGKPVYFDCRSRSPNIDLIGGGISDIDILIAPSMYGIPVELPDERNFKLIEDIAQSFGATSFGDRIGLRGDVGICSFYATKVMTTGGQGGALISRDIGLIEEARDYLQFDCRNDDKLRFNFQMTDLQAAIGRAQLKKMPLFIAKREEIYAVYASAGLDLLHSLVSNDVPIRYRAVVQTDEAERAIKALKRIGVSAIIPIESWELLGDPDDCPNALQLSRHTVSLPIYPSLSAIDAEKIAITMKRFL